MGVFPLTVPFGAKVTLNEGMVLAGWGKAKFREPSKEHPLDAEKELLFHVSPDDLGVWDGVNGTFGDFLTANKVKTPGIQVCYHTCDQDPEGAWTFKKEGVLN